MAIPWWTQYGILGHPEVEAHVEHATRRAWWGGFWQGLLIGVVLTVTLFTVKAWLKY